MPDPLLEGAVRQQLDERLAEAARSRRAADLTRRRSAGRTRHTLATSLRRFADKLDS